MVRVCVHVYGVVSPQELLYTKKRRRGEEEKKRRREEEKKRRKRGKEMCGRHSVRKEEEGIHNLY